jgi:hypothetical protein
LSFLLVVLLQDLCVQVFLSGKHRVLEVAAKDTAAAQKLYTTAFLQSVQQQAVSFPVIGTPPSYQVTDGAFLLLCDS